VFERFTDRARRVVVLAQEEARLLNHNYIGTEHLLLGLVHEGEGVAAKALREFGITEERARAEVEAIIGRGGNVPSGQVPFTPRAKKVLELSLREALQLGHNYIGTEHILLGIVNEGEGVAVQVLTKLGAHLDGVRGATLELLGAYSESAERPSVAQPSCPTCHRDLAGRVAVQAVTVTVGESASIDQQVLVAYCRSCGCSIGLVAASPPVVTGTEEPPPTT